MIRGEKEEIKEEKDKEELIQKEEQRRLEEERKESERLRGEAKRKERLERIRKEREKVVEEKFPRGRDLLIIGIIALLALLLIDKITFRAKAKSPMAKAPPKKTKTEEFEPRDLKKFLKKKSEDKDKDLFK